MTPRKRASIAIVSVSLSALGTVLAQSVIEPTQARAPRQLHPPTPQPRTDDMGGPLSGLTGLQSNAFVAGRDEFEATDDAASGLGPVFNNVSCVSCHSDPATGGGSVIVETRFGRMQNGNFDPLTEKGGSLLQDKAIDPAAQETLPTQANVVAKRKTTPLFGAGLIEAIPDATILASASQSKPDGVSGHAAMIQDVASGTSRVGRFGWKAQQATLLAFAGDAYLNEMGITNRLFPTENAPNGIPGLLQRYDLVADPEDNVDPATGRSDIDAFADFMRMLAPPQPMQESKTAAAGAKVFSDIGCQHCHTPSMTTGSSDIAALDHKSVPLFSDLLLHDMGSLGDGVAQADANPTEMKTAPLWGLRARAPYLHDGRAATVDAAILAHDGEGATARDRFKGLSPDVQSQLVDYLNTL
jgi:CxxC motif-containing protein (DUF1111 family)